MTDAECAAIVKRWEAHGTRHAIMRQLQGSRVLSAYVANLENPPPIIAEFQDHARHLAERPAVRGCRGGLPRGSYR